MKLATGKAKLEQMLQNKSDKLSDLSLNEAQRWLDESDPANNNTVGGNSGSATTDTNVRSGSGSRSGGGDRNPSDFYDEAQQKLIKKLQALSVEEAEAAAKETIKHLKETVAAMKAVAENALAKAA
jgi:hypothetical protein